MTMTTAAAATKTMTMTRQQQKQTNIIKFFNMNKTSHNKHIIGT